MRPSPCRPFGVGDLMTLVAAAAVAVAGTRLIYDNFQGETLLSLDLFKDSPESLVFLLLVGAVWMSSLMGAVLVSRLRRPRPRLAVIERQPGTAACFTAGLAAAAQALTIFVKVAWWSASASAPVGPSAFKSYALSNPGLLVIHPLPFAAWLVAPCGYAVAGAWLTLALTGRWRAERSWIDRAGRALGIVWIALSAIAAIGI